MCARNRTKQSSSLLVWPLGWEGLAWLGSSLRPLHVAFPWHPSSRGARYCMWTWRPGFPCHRAGSSGLTDIRVWSWQSAWPTIFCWLNHMPCNSDTRRQGGRSKQGGEWAAVAWQVTLEPGHPHSLSLNDDDYWEHTYMLVSNLHGIVPKTFHGEFHW